MSALARKLIRRVWKIGLANGFSPRGATARHDYQINERADLKAAFDRVDEDGMIAVVRSGMDCDCTQYHSVSIIQRPGLMAWQKSEDEHRQWLDGTEHTWFESPTDHPEGNQSLTSDRALAAYEDGHASFVTWADTSEMHG